MEKLSSLFVICTTKVEGSVGGNGAAAATTAGGAAVATAKRKRDEDDSDNEGKSRGDGFDFQELIDLHEDARRHQQKKPPP